MKQYFHFNLVFSFLSIIFIISCHQEKNYNALPKYVDLSTQNKVLVERKANFVGIFEIIKTREYIGSTFTWDSELKAYKSYIYHRWAISKTGNSGIVLLYPQENSFIRIYILMKVNGYSYELSEKVGILNILIDKASSLISVQFDGTAIPKNENLKKDEKLLTKEHIPFAGLFCAKIDFKK